MKAPIHRILLSIGFLAVLVILSQACAGDDTTEHNHWLFSSPVRSPVPKAGQGWARNPIDCFIAESLERLQIEPSRPASRLEILRRASFDITGLPPSILEQQEFAGDASEQAYEKLVERLLASPRFGERWARHWLDVVRFAETDGFKSDKLRPDAYRYRDYVIKAANSDLPYNDFVRQQLAGDETEPNNSEALVATGLNRLYADEDNAANLFQRRQEILDEITDVTSLTFMGLTMGCAQCHDHKFDEILQEDYFRLQAFFAPIVERNDFLIGTREQISAYQQQLAAWNEATRSIRSQIDSLFAELRKKDFDYKMEKFSREIQACVSTPPADRSPLEEQIARMALKQAESGFEPEKAAEKLSEADRKKYNELKQQLAQFSHLKPSPLPTIMAVSDIGATAPPTHLLIGGNWRNPDAEVEPGIPAQFEEASGTDTVLTSARWASTWTTGRRAHLAAWLTRPDHPLTARVIVNRIWQHYFGNGIVATPNDFGVQGSPPSHPELLDWLAVELVEHNWSLKHIHRLILTSATYRQTSLATNSRAVEQDPGNRLLWRANRRRIPAESIRDAMLATAGVINYRMYGPGVRPKLPEGISVRYAWEPDEDVGNRFRRSVYVFAKRNMRFPLFDDFDLPDMHQSCGKRAETTTAPQALALLNGADVRNLAVRWADKLVREGQADIPRIVDTAYRTAWGRSPDETETEIARRFLEQSANLQESITDFCHALFNTNEFIYID
jgi:hypothetical protein